MFSIPCIVAPYNVVVMGNNLYSQGDQLQLNCSSEGGPQLEYTWTFSGSIITDANSNILTIDNITTSNGGNYTCNVTNNAGSDASTITAYGKQFEVIINIDFYCTCNVCNMSTRVFTISFSPSLIYFIMNHGSGS